MNYSGNQKAWWQTLEPWQGQLWDRENLIGSSSLDRIQTKSAGVALLFSTEIACTYISAWSHRCTLWTFQEEEARILAATNSTIAVECNELEAVFTPAGSTHLLAGKASRERRRVNGWQLERPKQLCTRHGGETIVARPHEGRTQKTAGRLDVHRKAFRHRSPGHDLLWTGSNPQDSSSLVTAHGTGSANGVEERLTYTSTKANDNAGRPPSYRH